MTKSHLQTSQVTKLKYREDYHSKWERLCKILGSNLFRQL